MQENGTATRRVSLLAWTLGGAAATSLGLVLLAWHGPAGTSSPGDAVVVVDSPLRPTPPSTRPLPLPTAAGPPGSGEAPVTSPVVAAAHIAQAYPLLRDVSLRCTHEQCALSGRILPMEAQAELDRRQEMLLGGLAAVLAGDGYRLVVPFRLEEIDSNLFHLQASVIPESRRPRRDVQPDR